MLSSYKLNSKMELFIKNEMEKNQVILYINNNVMEDIFI